jgi:hypothetical protein
VYATPKGSPYADEGLFDNIATEVGMIQDLGGNILFTSDFNARTSAADDYVKLFQWEPSRFSFQFSKRESEVFPHKVNMPVGFLPLETDFLKTSKS